MNLEALRYPIGRFVVPDVVSPGQVTAWIDDIERLPGTLQSAVRPLTPQQLETPYRPSGWCARQVVHHLADSHLNSVIRFKWALTEERPIIKPYFEDRWAELPDYLDAPITVSLRLLEVLHERWVYLLRSLDASQLQRELVHPDSGVIRLDVNVGVYAWHGHHHLAHINRLAEREGWTS